MKRDLPRSTSYFLGPGRPSPGVHSFLRHPFGNNASIRDRNVYRLSIEYASRLPLRSRLTLGG